MIKYITTVLLLFLLFIALSAQAQQKIYYTLGTKYKGLRKDQVKLNEYNREFVASFIYKDQSYKIYFSHDTVLVRVAAIHTLKALPALIKKELNCLFKEDRVREWRQVDYYKAGILIDQETRVYLDEGRDSYLLFVYNKNLTRVDAEDYLTRNSYGEYVPGEMWAGAAPFESTAWYGGSINAFSDSITKHVRFSSADTSCLNPTIGKSFYVGIHCKGNGEIKYINIGSYPPYIMEDRLTEYLKSLPYPVDAGLYEEAFYYSLYVTWAADKGLFIDTRRRY